LFIRNTNTIFKEALKSKGYRLIEIRKTEAVYDAVSSHADIYLCRVGGGLIVAPEQLPFIRDALTACGVEFASGTSRLGFRYPMNAKYNAAQVGSA
jgi:N-dimethylarginine dimethylaminohydrolase